MLPGDFTLLFIAVVLVVITGRTAIPLMLFLFQPHIMRFGFLEDAEGERLRAKSPQLMQWISDLEKCGFRYLGIKIEKMPFWGGTFREVAFTSASEEAFAAIVLRPDRNPASVYYYSPLTDGGMVFTRNGEYGREAESEGISVINIPTDDFGYLLEAHRQRLQAFKTRGFSVNASFDRPGRIKATETFYASTYARQRGFILQSPHLIGFIIALFFLTIVVFRQIQ